MRNLLIILCITICCQTASAQVRIGTFAGISNYYGDLTDKFFTRSKPALGLTLNYELSEQFNVRAGLTVGRLQAADKYSGSEELVTMRNLEFQSDIQEISLLGEVNLFSGQGFRVTPYLFAGVAAFHFNPYATSSSGEKIYLRPLSTEGQGLPGYEDRESYSLFNFSIPSGAGIKFHLSESVALGLEIGYRKTFTDYIDDVSKSYVDPDDLLTNKGAEAVVYSFRANQNPLGRSSYPSPGEVRGNPKKNDSYYFTGVHFTFRLPSFFGGGSSRYYSDFRCPPSPR